MPSAEELEERIGIQFDCWEKAQNKFDDLLDIYEKAEMTYARIYKIIKTGILVGFEEMRYERTVNELQFEDSDKFDAYKENNEILKRDGKLQSRYGAAIIKTTKLIGKDKVNEISDSRVRIIADYMQFTYGGVPRNESSSIELQRLA